MKRNVKYMVDEIIDVVGNYKKFSTWTLSKIKKGFGKPELDDETAHKVIDGVKSHFNVKNENTINRFKQYLNEASEPKMMLLDAIDMLSLASTRIIDASVASKLDKIINDLNSLQRKVK